MREAAAMLRGYRAALAIPHVRLLVAAATLHGVASATAPLPLILLVAEQTGSYASAGIASGAFFVGTSITAPVRGRAVDRFGALPIILPMAVLDTLALVAIVVLAATGAPTAAIVVVAALAGALLPPSISTLRTLWSQLTRTPEEQQAANALQSVILDAVNVAGPLLGGALAAAASPEAALATAAACMLLAGTTFAVAPPARAWSPPPAERTRLGPLAAPGIRTMILASITGGAAVGVLDLAAPAFADDRGSGAAGAIPLAALAAGSVAGALLYGARRWAAPTPARYLRLHVLLVPAVAATTAAGHIATLALLMLLAGLVLGPITTTTFGLLDDLAPKGTTTEALTWLIAAFSTGAAGGSALAGAIHESAGSRAALAAAAAAELLTLAVIATRRRTLVGAPALAPR
jgi:MFS family permease